MKPQGKSPKKAPTVSVIIPVYNGGENFRRCLEALASSRHVPVEVIVVDDGSTDRSPRVASTCGHRLLRTSRPRSGPAAARNHGAKAAKGDILLFVDADVAVRPSTVGMVAEVFSRNPGTEALFGSYDNNPAERGFVSQYKNLFHHYVHQNSGEAAKTFWAGCGAVRRRTFFHYNGFDSRRYRRPSIEDIDLGYRMAASGTNILLVKKLQVKHLKKWSLASLLRSDIFDRGIPWTRLLLERHADMDDLNLKSASRYSTAALYASLAGLFLFPALPKAGWVVGAGLSLALVLNWDLYRWFAGRKGVLFSLGAVLLHWLYYLYSGLAFSIGLVLHLASHPPLSQRRGGKGERYQIRGRSESPNGSSSR